MTAPCRYCGAAPVADHTEDAARRLWAAAAALSAGMPAPGQIGYQNYYLRVELIALREALGVRV